MDASKSVACHVCTFVSEGRISSRHHHLKCWCRPERHLMQRKRSKWPAHVRQRVVMHMLQPGQVQLSMRC